MERRKHPRFSVTLPASFSGHTVKGTGQALDLSMAGCRIESDRCPKNSDYLEVILRLPDPEPPLTIESAVVRWTRDRVFGLEFLYLSSEATTRLGRLIESLWRQLKICDRAEQDGERGTVDEPESHDPRGVGSTR